MSCVLDGRGTMSSPAEYLDLFDWPIGDNAHYELRVADEGMIDAPMFQAGDVLAEIEN